VILAHEGINQYLGVSCPRGPKPLTRAVILRAIQSALERSRMCLDEERTCRRSVQATKP
jgi:hypothetical protein